MDEKDGYGSKSPEDVQDVQDVQRGPLRNCERCSEKPATTKLVFTYRGEEYAEHFYCEPCCDLAWAESVKVVDAKSAALKEHGL